MVWVSEMGPTIWFQIEFLKIICYWVHALSFITDRMLKKKKITFKTLCKKFYSETQS